MPLYTQQIKRITQPINGKIQQHDDELNALLLDGWNIKQIDTVGGYDYRHDSIAYQVITLTRPVTPEQQQQLQFNQWQKIETEGI